MSTAASSTNAAVPTFAQARIGLARETVMRSAEARLIRITVMALVLCVSAPDIVPIVGLRR